MTVRLLTTAAIAFCMGTNAMANDYKAGSIEIRLRGHVPLRRALKWPSAI